jgi:predicted adenine nucleotide alpha hydrolase (AANH) superfamily ATPase
MAETVKKGKPGFLLHICCAPCSPHPIRELKKDYDITLYFYNPNIHPESEYRLRLAESVKLAEIENIPLIVGDYRPEKWVMDTLKFKNEPEGGKRCEICIGDRLEEAAKKAAALGKQIFGTVLTVSPHKDAVMINRLGNAAADTLSPDSIEVRHFEANFKKKEGFKISSRISKELGFVRQSYCGCLYSRFEAVQAGRCRVGTDN